MNKLHKYVDSLLLEAKERYKEKIALIGNVDPFKLHTVAAAASALPPVDGSDLVSYLVLQMSFVTVKQLKAHKSMEVYNQFACGWVKDVKA